jgi:hypothetical protein
MNTLSKLLLVFVLLSGITACTASGIFNMSGNQVIEQAAEIVDFDLPPGYSPDFSARLMGYTVVSFRPPSQGAHLFLIQSNGEADIDQLAGMLEELVPGETDPRARTTVSETRPITVRGEESTLIITEGINSNSETYRQAMLPFEGKGGPALLLLSAPFTSWNQETVDTFIASIE